MNEIELNNLLYLAQSYKSIALCCNDYFNIDYVLIPKSCILYAWYCDKGYVRVYKEYIDFTRDVLWSPELPLIDKDKIDKILKLQAWW